MESSISANLQKQEETMTPTVEWITTLQKRIQCRMQRKSINQRHFIIQGPYTIGITFSRYQDLPPTFHTVAGSLTSDPLICLLYVPPVFHETLGEAFDRLGEMLASNLILSIHVRDDWVREEGVHEPRLSIAFTMTGPPMTEAVRSMIQDAIRTTLNNPRATVLLPNSTPHPIPWKQVEELSDHHLAKNPATAATHNSSGPRPPRQEQATAAQPSQSAWQAVSRTHNQGPVVTQTFDISGIQGLPETINRLNVRMSEIEANAQASQAKQDTQFANVFTLLTTMSQSVQSLVVAAQATPRDSPP